MGTELEQRGVRCELPLWSAAALLEAPETVLEIHRENVRAGADVLSTNTFRTHRRSLEKKGLGNVALELTRKAVALAREATEGARRPVFVMGSLSPLEDCYRPDLVPGPQVLQDEHLDQARALASAGVDGLLVETHNDLRELCAAVRAAKATGLPVVASMITDGEGSLLSGDPIPEVVRALRASPPDALSINCVPARRLWEDLERLAAAAPPNTPLGAYGNLGPPADPEKLHFLTQIGPEEYSQLAEKWIALGARIVGGCCGTTPAHTAALRKFLDSRS